MFCRRLGALFLRGGTSCHRVSIIFLADRVFCFFLCARRITRLSAPHRASPAWSWVHCPALGRPRRCAQSSDGFRQPDLDSPCAVDDNGPFIFTGLKSGGSSGFGFSIVVRAFVKELRVYFHEELHGVIDHTMYCSRKSVSSEYLHSSPKRG